MDTELNYDRSLHDKEHAAGPFEVTIAIIQKVNDSLGETEQAPITATVDESARNQGFTSDVAPPTLCSIFMRDVNLPDVGLDFGHHQMHAGHRFQPKAPVYAGDRLTTSSFLREVYAKTGRSGIMVFIVWNTTFRNQDGEVVAEIQESFARRE